MSRDAPGTSPAGTRRFLLQAGAAAMVSGLAAAPARAQSGGGRTYVLVHGAWFGGWVWKPVATALRAMGHTVYAPSLTGLGDRKHLLGPEVNLDTHANDIVNLIQLEDLEKVVLVGWSYGGMVISDVLARIPERIASMVYLDAFAPETGKSQMSYANRSGSVEAVMNLAAQLKPIPLPAPAVLSLDNHPLAGFILPRLSPHPTLTALQPSKSLAQRPAGIPHTYVKAAKTPSTTFQPFYDMFKDDPRATAILMDTFHTLMLTEPQATTQILANVK